MKQRTTPSIAGASLLGLLAMSPLAQAHEEEQKKTQPQQQAQPQQQQAEQMVIARDAETGQLRAATAQELAALQAAKLQPKAASAAAGGLLKPQVMRHSSGAVGVGVSDEMASHLVMGKRPDGTLAEACFESKSAADEAVKNGAASVNLKATEK